MGHAVSGPQVEGGPSDMEQLAGFEVVIDMSREQMGRTSQIQWATSHPDVGRSTGNSSGMECAEGDM